VLRLLALWVCVQEWRGTFGSVLWFGWLTVAALALIFALALGVRQEAAHKGHHRHGRRLHQDAAEDAAGAARVAGEDAGKVEGGCSAACRACAVCRSSRFRQAKRGAVWGAFILLPCLFLLSGWRGEPWPVLREDAVAGKVGPWDFTIAEVETGAPKIGGSGAVMKAFALRFAEAAQPDIRAAYLQAREPRSLKASGIAFAGNHLRTANILIPPAFQPEEQIWLTVEGRNGEVHQTALDVARVSPSLARFLAKEESAQKSDEGWDATLIC
jgi:hypothetical protein